MPWAGTLSSVRRDRSVASSVTDMTQLSCTSLHCCCTLAETPPVPGHVAQEEFAALHACTNGTERVVLCTLWLRSAISKAAQDGILYAYGFTQLDSAINDMTALFQSGCRLCFVPMPFPYAQVLKQALKQMRAIMA